MNFNSLDAVASFGSLEYLILVLLVAFGRGMDLFSTWIATPTLELEANPLARWLGWRAGAGVNLAVAFTVAVLPLAAIAITTTSLLVAARNLQSAWLIRSLGEHEYRVWIAARYQETRRGVFVICLTLHAGLTALVGIGLMVFSQSRLVPFAVGFGILIYALAVAIFTGLSMRRAARSAAELATFAPRRPV